MNEQTIVEMLKKQEQILVKIEKGISAPQKSTQEIDLVQVGNLSTQLQSSIEKMSEVVDAAHKPVVSERRFTIDIVSKSTLSLFIGMLVIIVLLFAKLYHETRPNYDQRDNDLKYRYIKMKGEASPSTIFDLEDMFELNRDNAKIRQMLEIVKAYEEAVRKRAIADEQARLNQLESERQNDKAESEKKK